jgi:hypothetical protein
LTFGGFKKLTRAVIDEHLCYLGKRHKEMLNLRQGIARLEFAAHQPENEIDEWVALAFENNRSVLEEAASEL